MNCPHCNYINDADADFCMGCGKSIIGSPSPNADFGAQQRSQVEYQDTSARIEREITTGLSSSSHPAPNLADGIHGAGELLVMRASNESEGVVLPGYRRSLEIRHESSAHLAGTDRRLEPQQLLARVRHILEIQEVPVNVQLVNARWSRDTREMRPRLVASLRNHTFSNVKMILGVDYMGNWASINMCVGIEPDPVPVPPKWKAPVDGIIALVIGVLTLIIIIGIIGIIYGVWRLIKSRQDHFEKIRREYEWQQARSADEWSARTFKKDDLDLFHTAMQRVFQAVVDDIVELGGEVVRIEGGRNEAASQSARHSDAAEFEV
jgi:hypothetical protein